MTLVEALRPGQIVVDVGANVGGVARQYQAVGAEVWAIEPDPRCWRALREVVGGDRLLGMAVGDQEGVLTLYRSADAAHNSLAAVNLVEPRMDLPPVRVPLSTLDALQAGGQLPGQIDAIKVDAQGSEVAIVRGARQIVRTQHPLWWIEIWPQGLIGAGTSVEALCRLFEAEGYAPVGTSWPALKAHCALLQGHNSTDVLLTA